MKYLCVHGHFYQPPRENPFTGAIPRETGAEPYQNWNQRINAECYRPNTSLGNFDVISFNLGPTLAAWLEKNDPATYRRILAADRVNVANNGVGNAMAQVYNHTILPLATRNDKEIQVAWGIADFQHRFGHLPEGMWLAETAVDLETLDVLAQFGIAFTVLAPWQAENPHLDLTEPYLVRLPSGRARTVVFFDAQLAKHICWTPYMTEDAQVFARMCLPMRADWFKEKTAQDQLLLIASDGEFYGHHNRNRTRFLKEFLAEAAPAQGFEVTYLAKYLHHKPAVRETRIAENTAWSCYHGLGRWKESCGCIPADGTWKTAFRQALDGLAARLDDLYLQNAWVALDDPWQTVRDYIKVKLGDEGGPELVARHAAKTLTAEETSKILGLLEAMYYRQWMYTSCGFFFDELSRIEPTNNLAYAARAIILAQQATGTLLEAPFLADLRRATSTHTGQTGEDIYWAILRAAPVA
ncbi:MAG: DUF3536 domain-containing protein [Chloroflexi bacterium]|nr:DUF3536 domain-containing protein [Chloroflexota bacterium]